MWFLIDRRRLIAIERKLQQIMDAVDQLKQDFTTFQADFSAFVSNTQALLQQVAAGGLTTDQSTALNTIDAGLQEMDKSIKVISFPTTPATPSTPTS